MKHKSVYAGLIFLSLCCVLLLTGCVSKSKYETLQTSFTSLESEHGKLQANYENLQKELTDIKKVYPPHDFASVKDLQDWISQNIQPESKYLEDNFRSALKVQTAGIKEGYLISVMYDVDDSKPNTGWIYNATTVDGALYYWDPSNTDVYEDYKWLTK